MFKKLTPAGDAVALATIVAHQYAQATVWPIIVASGVMAVVHLGLAIQGFRARKG